MLSGMESSSFVSLSKNKRGDTFLANPLKVIYSMQIIFCDLSKKGLDNCFAVLHFLLCTFFLASNYFFLIHRFFFENAGFF